MDKDEILSKHKNENRFGDEREKPFALGGTPSPCGACWGWGWYLWG